VSARRGLVRCAALALIWGTSGGSLAARPTQPTAPASRWVERVRGLMGTRFAIRARIERAEQAEALDRALERVDALERLWSPWIEGSDLHRINAAGGKPVVVEPATLALLERSLALCKASAGAFDPTFFALHGLWDFRAQPFVPPTDAAIAARLPAVGCAGIRLDAAARTVQLLRPGARLHLGANAKGTALDAAARVLHDAGLRDFAVDGGGDLVLSGQGPKGPWRVGVQDPGTARGRDIGRLALGAGAVATSGDYERSVVHQGRRYHHILDPRTGRPAMATRQVTVLVPAGPHAGERADALATALFVMGPERGRRWLAEQERGMRPAERTRVFWIAADGRRHASGVLPWVDGKG
jgi:thiamine biosynthesis lipoprotein